MISVDNLLIIFIEQCCSPSVMQHLCDGGWLLVSSCGVSSGDILSIRPLYLPTVHLLM